jgi:hypothetical protein
MVPDIAHIGGNKIINNQFATDICNMYQSINVIVHVVELITLFQTLVKPFYFSKYIL